MYIGSYYRPSSNDKSDSTTALQNSLEYLNNNTIKNNAHVTGFRGGDFNSADIDWTNNSVVPDSNMKGLADSVISSLGDHGLT